MQTLCVFCSSSDAVDPVYKAAAAELGLKMAERGRTLVYGGTRVGLMGTVAQAVYENGGQVVGIIPENIFKRGIEYDLAHEMIVTPDMRERKRQMAERSDAFVVLPGGFGTLEEVLEVITLKQLQEHQKPIVFLNTRDFYAPLLTLFEHFYDQQVAKPASRVLYHIAPDVDGLFAYLDAYQPGMIESKWFDK